ncbi:type II secretion system protein N [Desulfovibrio inopinatus]|uniref:type II secretion system protein N n=1 Tax=Desulfovibrio inopinatus TaxID=102109 RepID=UPI0004216ACD|nr:type II secretion system protein N [Desulfovibrio inopinatus]
MRLSAFRWLAVLAACAALVVFGVDIAMRFSSGAGNVASGVAVRKQIEREIQPVKPRDAYDVIAGRNIFKEKRPEPADEPAAAKTPTALVDPGFGFEVVGTVHANRLDANVAVIMDKRTKEQRLYRAGDMLGDALVVEIRRNQVVIENKGKRELLTVDYEKNMPARNRPVYRHATPARTSRITPRSTPSVRSKRNPVQAHVLAMPPQSPSEAEAEKQVMPEE